MNSKLYKGFSLIELVIVVTVISVLAAIGIPSYNHYVFKSRRSEAMTALLSAQSAAEEYRAQNKYYPTTQTINNTAHYSYIYTANANTNPSGYTIVATAQGLQANDKENNTRCTTLTVDSVGTKAPADCWIQ